MMTGQSPNQINKKISTRRQKICNIIIPAEKSKQKVSVNARQITKDRCYFPKTLSARACVKDNMT